MRFCALQLAEGTIGDLEKSETATVSDNLPTPENNNGSVHSTVSETQKFSKQQQQQQQTTTWDDNEIHIYFWFPLLSGLSKLTFDERSLIRISALEVLFDILRYHGNSFNASFWSSWAP